jgi:hypothetical protein
MKFVEDKGKYVLIRFHLIESPKKYINEIFDLDYEWEYINSSKRFKKISKKEAFLYLL